MSEMPLHSNAKASRLAAIREQMVQAGGEVAALPVAEWWTWIMFLLEVLAAHAEARGEREVYADVLRAVQLDIDARLSQGGGKQ